MVIALAAALVVASFVEIEESVPFVMEVAFIAASIKDDIVAEIITVRIAVVEVQTTTADAAAVTEEEHLVVVRIGFGSWERQGRTGILAGVREDLLC